MLHQDKLEFKYCPAYAQFLLNNKVEEFASAQLLLLYEIKIPLLKYLDALPEEELMELVVKSSIELLTAFAENKVSQFIESSLASWMSNQLPMMRRNEIQAEDLTSISFVRRKVFRDLLTHYTNDIQMYIKIMEEIDQYTVEFEAAYFTTYLDLQKEEITKINISLQNQETPIFEAIDILAKNNYNGFFSFEWEKLWHPEIEEPEIALADYAKVMKEHFKEI